MFQHIPLIFDATAIGAAWLYVYSLGGTRLRSALTLGVYGRSAPTVAGYRPGSPSWARQRMFQRNPDHADHAQRPGYADLIDAPPAPRPPRFPHMPIFMAVPDGATDADVAELVTTTRAVAAAHWGAPVLDADGAVAVQHAVPLDSYDQLADLTATGEYAPWGPDFLPRLLGTLHGQASTIQLDGWGTGEWRVSR